MRKLIYLVICLNFLFCTTSSLASETVPLDRTVAIVNKEVITQGELDETIRAMKAQAMEQGINPPPEKKLKKEALDQAINDHLQLQVAERNNITVTQKEINDTIEKIAENNHTTVDALKQLLKANDVSYKEYQEKIKKQMLIAKLQRKAVVPQINVSPKEIKAFIQKHKQQEKADQIYQVADLLVPIPNKANQKEIQKAKKHADDLLAKLHKDADFHSLAMAESSNDTALQGGNLGWRKLEELPSLFSKKVAKMKVGQVAGPILAPNGFHLIKLVAKRNTGEKLTDEKARALLFERQFQTHLAKWLEQLRSTAYIKIEK